jgi:hypothetical protein
MDTLLRDSHPIARVGHMLGAFATFLGGALLPIALLLLGIGLTRPGSLAIFAGVGALQTLPLAGLGLAGVGWAACRATERAAPVSCRLGLALNLAAWLVNCLA